MPPQSTIRDCIVLAVLLSVSVQQNFYIGHNFQMDMERTVNLPEEDADTESEAFFKEVNVPEINKRELGKLQIKLIGNEGADTDNTTDNRRKMIQTCIDFLRQRPQHIWKNAEISIFDSGFNGIIIKSGKGKHAFLCVMDEKGEPAISDVSQKTCNII